MAGLPVGATTPGATLEPWMLVGLLLVLVVGAAAVVLWRRRGAEAPAVGTGGTVAGDRSDPTATASGSAPGAEPDIADEEFLPDDERVLAILRDNGGRMRQSAIVAETDWSKSKVSMLLSDMEDEDDVTRLRVGRENIVSLPGYEPEATRSPYDES